MRDMPVVLLGDSVGTGKTVQALVDAHNTGGRALVVCPKAVLLSWQREARYWLGVNAPIVCTAADPVPPTGLVLCSWSRIVDRAGDLGATGLWDTLIIDESHWCKSEKAQRTIAVLGSWLGGPNRIPGLIDTAKRIRFLTGTPIPNRTVELQTVLAAASLRSDNEFLRSARSWQQFAARYADLHQVKVKTKKGWQLKWDDTGASNLEELRDQLRSSIMIRRLKADVMAELPEVRRQVVPLDVDGVPKPPAAWNPREIAAAVGAGKVPAFEGLSEYRHALGLAKANAVAEYVAGMVADSGKALVLFTYHRAVAEKIAERLLTEYTAQSIVTHGGDDGPVRQGKVDRFSRGEGQIFIGTIGATGTGMNGLQTRTDDVVFGELDWTPGTMEQAIGRLHRIGQRGSVLARYLVTEDDLDAYVLGVLLEKEVVQGAVLDGKQQAAVEFPSWLGGKGA